MSLDFAPLILRILQMYLKCSNDVISKLYNFIEYSAYAYMRLLLKISITKFSTRPCSTHNDEREFARKSVV